MVYEGIVAVCCEEALSAVFPVSKFCSNLPECVFECTVPTCVEQACCVVRGHWDALRVFVFVCDRRLKVHVGSVCSSRTFSYISNMALNQKYFQ